MKKLFALLAVPALAAALVVAEDAKKFSATCPVSGGPAKEASAVDYLGRKVYFCCDNCPKAFKADTAKFAAKANAQLLQTGQATQIACPISGKACSPEHVAEVAGSKVAFCCPNCQGKVAGQDAAGKLASVFANFSKGFTVQTACPVSGKPIKADQVVEHKGTKVYFCCPGCPAAFQKDPAKFEAKLPQLAAKPAAKSETK